MEWPRGLAAVRAAVHARPRERRLDRGASAPGVKGWEVGEAVAVYGPWGCGRCRPCRTTLETLCERARGARRRRRRPRPRRRHGGVHARPGSAAARAARRPRPARRRAALRRRADAVPRDQARARTSSSRARARSSSASAASATWPCRSCARCRRRDVIATDVDAGQARARARASAPTTRSRPARTPRPRSASSPAAAAPTLVLDCVGSDATLALDAKVVASGRRGDGHRRRRRHAADYRFNTLPSDASLTHPYWGSIDRARRGARAGARGPHHARTSSTSRSSASPTPTSGCATARSPGRAVITPHG